MLTYSPESELNSPAIDFSLISIDGKNYSLKNFADKDILVIVFMCNHCPYVKAIINRFVKFQKKFAEKGVQLIGINPNDEISYPEDSYENMKIFAGNHNMNFPYLRDDTQEIAKKYGAVCTPDIFVYNKERKLKYRGRFDDNWQDENKVNSEDLSSAIEMILKGRDVDFRQIPSMGCSIKWKN